MPQAPGRVGEDVAAVVGVENILLKLSMEETGRQAWR